MPGMWNNFGDKNFLEHGGMQVRRAYTDEEIKTAELDANKNLDWMKKHIKYFGCIVFHLKSLQPYARSI